MLQAVAVFHLTEVFLYQIGNSESFGCCFFLLSSITKYTLKFICVQISVKVCYPSLTGFY